MSRSLTERLSGFTPDGSGVDRDAILWEAGRRSGRKGRGAWMGIAGLLSVTQAVTMAVLWPEPAAPVPSGTPPTVVEEPELLEPEPAPSESEPPPLVRRWELPPQPAGIPDLVAPDRPLTVSALSRDESSDLLDF